MGYINTIRDLEAATYGLPAFGGNSVLKQAGAVQGLHTAHDIADAGASGVTGIGTTTGMYNQLYGQKVWSMLNREVNALAMLMDLETFGLLFVKTWVKHTQKHKTKCCLCLFKFMVNFRL